VDSTACLLYLGQPEDKPNSAAFLPLADLYSNESAVLARHNITSVGLPHIKLTSLLRLVKDNLGLRKPGVYNVRFEVFTAVTMKNGVFWVVTPCGVRRLLVAACVVPSSQIFVTLMKEAPGSS
jgi:hypothetical protein